jgi:hypothetical protein
MTSAVEINVRQVAGTSRRDLHGDPPDIHPVAAAVFEALEGAGVRWCLLRGERRLEDPPHDVDLLVAQADLLRMARAVRPLGFLPVPTWGRGSHQFFVAYVESLDHWFILDVVTELAYGPAYALRSDAGVNCLARRERIGPLALLSADDAFWTLLLHCVLDRGDIPSHQAERLRRLSALAQPDSKLAGFVAAACPPGWSPARLLAEARSGHWDVVLALGTQMIREWRRRHPVQFRLRSLADRVVWRLAPLHVLLAHRGLCLAIVSDEPGLARLLGERLQGRFYFPVAVVERAGLLTVRRQQSRGRLVAIPARRPPRLPRPDLVVRVTSDAKPARTGHPVTTHVVQKRDADLSRVRREVTALIWRAYGERRGWSLA